MSQVFVSYTRADRERVAALVSALQQQGLSVWWDGLLGAGRTWRDDITNELDTARCVIVVWTHASTRPGASFVLDEATRALKAGKLLPVSLDPVLPPLGFGEVQGEDLSAWDGTPGHQTLQRFAAIVEGHLATVSAGSGAMMPSPAMAMSKVRRRRWAPFGTLGVIAAVAAVVWWWQAGNSEREAWQARPPGNCDALRQHLALYPAGRFAEEASRRLMGRSMQPATTSRETAESLILYVASDDQMFPDVAGARRAALQRGESKAASRCEGMVSPSRQLISSAVGVNDWTCMRFARGVTCAFEGQARCVLRETPMVEHCH